jgi:hypothetical protein
MAAACDTDFTEVFEQRRDYCRALLELSNEQRRFIASDDFTALLGVLGKKQRLLGRIDDLTRQRPNLWRSWKTQRDDIAPEVREQCDHLLAETEALLAELLAEEQRSTDELTERRDHTQTQLQEISRGTRVHEAYRDGLSPSTHRHLDLNH